MPAEAAASRLHRDCFDGFFAGAGIVIGFDDACRCETMAEIARDAVLFGGKDLARAEAYANALESKLKAAGCDEAGCAGLTRKAASSLSDAVIVGDAEPIVEHFSIEITLRDVEIDLSVFLGVNTATLGSLQLGPLLPPEELQALSARLDEVMLGKKVYEGVTFQLDPGGS